MSSKPMPVWIWFAAANIVFFVLVGGTVGWMIASGWFNRPEVVVESPPKRDENREPREQAPQKAATEEPALSVAEIVKQVDGGVAFLNVKNSGGNLIGFGSGFIIHESGLLATNFHVLQGASQAEAVFDGERTIAIKGVRAWDAQADLAILELASRPEGTEVLKLCRGDERPQAAEVIAMGHPQALRLTTTTGIISAVHTTAELPLPYRNLIRAPANHIWIQSSAAISGGSSGGPLLNRAGEVIGINTWVAQGQNLGFAADARHLIKLNEKLSPEAISLADLTGPEEKLVTLAQGFANQRQWLGGELAKAGSEAAAKELIETRHPALDYLPKFVEFAEQHRGKPVAFSALQNCCEMAALPDCPQACAEALKQAGDRLCEDHGDDARLVPTMLRLGGSPLAEGRELLRRVAEKSTQRTVQAAAWLGLSMNLQQRPGEGSQSADEAIAIYERLQKEFANVELEGARLGDMVEPLLFVAKNLAVGRQPPEIEGKDQDGATFRLSEYRGKVVVLDFWADWCPHCVKAYSMMRQLMADNAGAPFALLGVNCDEPARLKRVIEQKKVTWRNWVDGPGGPIALNWRVEAFPTLYVLDHEGKIRYINVRDQALVDAVKELLAKVPMGDTR